MRAKIIRTLASISERHPRMTVVEYKKIFGIGG